MHKFDGDKYELYKKTQLKAYRYLLKSLDIPKFNITKPFTPSIYEDPYSPEI